MIGNANGCDVTPDGVTMPVCIYEKGKMYQVGDSLAKTFSELNVCEVAEQSDDSDLKDDEIIDDTETDEKQINGDPENKMQPSESENK